MFRYRRYRVFLAFAVIAIFALYKFSASGASWPSIASVRPGGGGNTASKEDGQAREKWEPIPKVAQDTNKLVMDIPAAKTPQATQTPPPTIAPVSRPADDMAATLSSMMPALIQSDWGLVPSPTSIPVIHWSKPSEHFPVATESLYKLPKTKPSPIPTIQFQFKKESALEKVDREQKASAIKGVFQRSWNGYKQHAWLQDELLPTTGGFKNPFAGWGATLVDALDTLWIMGLKDEFDEATKAVDKIDFTTTHRADIPLFETTIRYLGGLLGAYDVSGHKYKNLLVKAEELADVLISAFDTPNRMPELYYYWRPDFTANSHRASNRAVLAEVGSLSMEFTRLSQLTGNDKYYDAIARITDRLEEFQGKTRLPGMWPTYIDISGCKRIDYSSPSYNKPLQNPIPVAKGSDTSVSPLSIPPVMREKVPASRPLSEDPSWVLAPDAPKEIDKPQEDPRADKTAPMVKPASPGLPIMPGEKLSPGGNKYVPLSLPSPLILEADPLKSTKKSSIRKRQMGPYDPAEVPTRLRPTPALTISDFSALPIESRPVCEDIGFTSPSEHSEEEYTIGGLSDSTYEYLPKEWLLLGGAEPKYQKMYEAAVETMKENIIFRPMLPDNVDILVAGKMHVPPTQSAYGTIGRTMEPQQEHLTCFAGGMFGMGAKIFGRPQDMDLAKKITEGCIWSYNMTVTGIMPEGFSLLPCDNGKGKEMEGCEWNVTAYWEALDPWAEQRKKNYEDALKLFDEQAAIAQQIYDTELNEWQALQKAAAAAPLASAAAAAAAPVKDGLGVGIQAAVVTPLPGSAAAGANSAPSNSFRKRQLGDSEEDSLPTYSEEHKQAIGGYPGSPNKQPTKVTLDEEVPSPAPIPSPVLRTVYSPTPPMSHEEFVQSRLVQERLPIGVTNIAQRYYILRPEAIESVWYMYRITGNKYYRDVGWKMFEAISSATTDRFGNSAINDVTSASPILQNSMESFWLAETLKYFYLLFSEEDVISLDDWVLNTEAHPFKRPS